MKRASDFFVIPGLLLMSALAGPVGALALAPKAVPGHPILVIAPDPAGVIRAADGHAVGLSDAPFAALAQGGPGFADDALRNGAWFATDGRWIAVLCGNSSDE